MKLKALENDNNSVSNAQTGFPICNAFSNHIIFLSFGGGGGGRGEKKKITSKYNWFKYKPAQFVCFCFVCFLVGGF